MLLGVGIDLVQIKRIERTLLRYNTHFKDKVFTKLEQEKAESRAHPPATYAKCFAAKEAFLKALGTGLRHGITWTDVSISHLKDGKPTLLIKNQALKYLKKRTPIFMSPQIHVTLSDEKEYAQACVVLTATLIGLLRND